MSDFHAMLELNGALYELEGYLDMVHINHDYGFQNGGNDMTVKLEVRYAKMIKMEAEEV